MPRSRPRSRRPEQGVIPSRAAPMRSDSIGSTRGVSQLGLDGAGRSRERARRRQRRLLLQRGRLREAEAAPRPSLQECAESLQGARHAGARCQSRMLDEVDRVLGPGRGPSSSCSSAPPTAQAQVGGCFAVTDVQQVRQAIARADRVDESRRQVLRDQDPAVIFRRGREERNRPPNRPVAGIGRSITSSRGFERRAGWDLGAGTVHNRLHVVLPPDRVAVILMLHQRVRLRRCWASRLGTANHCERARRFWDHGKYLLQVPRAWMGVPGRGRACALA